MPRVQASTDSRILDILDTMKEKGMSVASFFEAFFDSHNHRIQSRRGWFFKQEGMRRVFRAMTQASKFASNKRQTATATAEINQTIKEDMVRLVMGILRHEMKALGKDKRSRLNPTTITPIACADFTVKDVQRVYEEKAPTLWRIVRILSGVPGIQSEEDAREDDDIDDGRLGDQPLENDVDEPYNDVDDDDLVNPDMEMPDDEDDWLDIDIEDDINGGMDRSNWVTERDLEAAFAHPDGARRRKRRKHRVQKDRQLMATMALAIMAYGRSRWNNTLQVCSRRHCVVTV
jgi:hypothetical protein